MPVKQVIVITWFLAFMEFEPAQERRKSHRPFQIYETRAI
jgi:hypothetical protein